jgi:sialate O-acetylesterase
LIGFEVAGADKKFFAATATIVGDAIEVRSEKVGTPAYVRHAWAGSPEANLYNDSDLPASPFISESNYKGGQ